MILLPLHCDSPIEITSIRSMWNHILQVAFSCLRSWPVSVFLNASDQGSAGIGMASSSRIYSNSSSARMHILHRTLCLASGKGVCLRGPSARHTKCLIFFTFGITTPKSRILGCHYHSTARSLGSHYPSVFYEILVPA